jgi:hypothetical protein
MSEVLLWLVSGLLGLLWLVIWAVNGWLACRMLFRGNFDAPSPLPIVGTLAGVVAAVLLPVGTLRDRIWLWALAYSAELVLLVEWVAVRIHLPRRPPTPTAGADREGPPPP